MRRTNIYWNWLKIVRIRWKKNKIITSDVSEFLWKLLSWKLATVRSEYFPYFLLIRTPELIKYKIIELSPLKFVLDHCVKNPNLYIFWETVRKLKYFQIFSKMKLLSFFTVAVSAQYTNWNWWQSYIHLHYKGRVLTTSF